MMQVNLPTLAFLHHSFNFILSMALCHYVVLYNVYTLSFHYSLWGDVHFGSTFHSVPHPSSSDCSLYLWLFECGKFHLVLKLNQFHNSREFFSVYTTIVPFQLTKHLEKATFSIVHILIRSYSQCQRYSLHIPHHGLHVSITNQS